MTGKKLSISCAYELARVECLLRFETAARQAVFVDISRRVVKVFGAQSRNRFAVRR